MIRQFLACAVATIGFASLYGVPTACYPLCGLCGAVCWCVNLGLMSLGVSEVVSVFLATLVTILLCRLFAVRFQYPLTVFLISAILPVVPGYGICWTAYYLVTNQTVKAETTGYLALKCAVAIVLAIVAALEVPQKLFALAAPKKGKKKPEA